MFFHVRRIRARLGGTVGRKVEILGTFGDELEKTPIVAPRMLPSGQCCAELLARQRSTGRFISGVLELPSGSDSTLKIECKAGVAFQNAPAAANQRLHVLLDIR